MHKTIVIVAGLALSLAVPPLLAAQQYIAIRLDSQPHSWAVAINASGHATGYASFDSPAAPVRAVLFANGTATDLKAPVNPSAQTASYGQSINSSGEVTGYVSGARGPTELGPDIAFLYSGGVTQSLGTLGGAGSQGTGINDRGQVTGSADFSSDHTSHAFLYFDGVIRDVGTLGGTFSDGAGINVNGDITGSSSLAGNLGGIHAFRLYRGAMQDLGTLGGTNSRGYRINARGDVTGWSEVSGGRQRAFLYSGDAMHDLGTLGGLSSFGYGINDDGWVVGSSFSDDSAREPRAFLYSGATMHDLNSLVVSGLAGMTLIEATDINASGQIVANACDAPGVCHAYRLDPLPAPAPVPTLSDRTLTAAVILLIAAGALRLRSIGNRRTSQPSA
jgi:probable HAF family extracellular repeat protein